MWLRENRFAHMTKSNQLETPAAQERMRVLVVSNMYPSQEHPVQGIFVHEQVKALRRAGLDVRVVTGQPVWLWARHPLRAVLRHLRARRQRWPGWVDIDGVPIARFPFPAGAFSRVWLYPYFYAAALGRWLPALSRDFPYDIVHTHTAFLDGRAGAAAARWRRVPNVLTEHTGPLSSVTSDGRMRRHVQAGLDGADRLIAVSAALADDMMSQAHIRDPQSRLQVLPNGVDTRIFDPQAIAAAAQDIKLTGQGRMANVLEKIARALEGNQGLLTPQALADALREVAKQEGRPTPQHEAGGSRSWMESGGIHALWVGHHVEVKRVDRLLTALAIARRTDSRIHLTFLGDGPLEAAMRALARDLGIERAVRFLPAANRSGVRQAMFQADFLTLPSATETFGVVLIEALSMGLPVLATDCGGPRDIVTDRRLGMIVENSEQGVAEGLLSMASQHGQFDQGEIRRLAVERFDFSRLARELVTTYGQVLARAAR